MANLGSCSHPDPERRDLYPARDYVTGDTFVIARCTRCGLARTLPVPSRQQMARYYPSAYYGQGSRYNPLLEGLLRLLYSRRAQHLHALRGAHPGRALDIGCGRGLLLAQLRALGWSVHGTELSATAAAYARDVLGIDVTVGDVSTVEFPEESADLVILWHVLEHVEDPAAILRQCNRLLVPGGSLLVAVPNFGSPEARLGRDAWFHLDVPRHLNHFTASVLRAYVEDAGLRVESARYMAIEYDLFSVVQTALNRLGLQANALYNALRVRGARILDGQAPRRYRDILISATLAPFIGVIGGVWTLIAARTEQGATVTLWVRKPETQAEVEGLPSAVR